MNFMYQYTQKDYEKLGIFGFNYPIRTKQTHPYNYDGFIIWYDGKNNVELTAEGYTIEDAYTDRMIRWDRDKFFKLCEKYGSDLWTKGNSESLLNFLKEYFDKPNLELRGIVEFCNQSSGFPCWLIIYKYKK